MKKLLLCLLLTLLLLPALCLAAPAEIITEGTYIMGDGETPLVAEERALVEAKRAAVEQAGTWLESYSEVQNASLTKDEIQVIASGVISATVLDKQRTVVPDGGIRFWVRIRAVVNTDSIAAMKDRLSDRRIIEDHKKLQASFTANQKELDDLKKKLASAQDSLERHETERQIAENERKFQAERWYEQGIRAQTDSDSIAAFSMAIRLNPYKPEYHFTRGFTYQTLRMHREALQDFEQAYALLTKLIAMSQGEQRLEYEMMQTLAEGHMDVAKKALEKAN